MESFIVHEWEELPVGKDGIPRPLARKLHALAERETQRLRVAQPVLRWNAKQNLQAGQVVGVMSVPGASIEILPKVGSEQTDAARHALTHMLTVALNLPVVASSPALMSTTRADVLEILISVFTDDMLTAARRGLPHRYLQLEDDIPLLRGKLDIRRQITRNVLRIDRQACRFDDLSVDTPLNRVLKGAVHRLSQVARTAANRRKLYELTARFELVSDVADPSREPVRLDRTNTSFHHLHALAQLFLSAYSQSTSSGRERGFGLLFPMNELFEKFIGRSMQLALAPGVVRLQNRGRRALESDGKGLFALKPDIVVDGDIVIDTKWKQLKPNNPTTLDVSQTDVYQMLTYARAYRARRLILLYPWHEKLPKEGVLRNWRVSGSSTAFDVATVDIGKPATVRRTLRAIVACDT